MKYYILFLILNIINLCENKKFISENIETSYKNNIFENIYNYLSDSEDYIANISFSVKCLYLANFSIYDISTLRKISFSDGIIDFSYKKDDKTYKYNFCTNLDKSSSKNYPRQVTVIDNLHNDTKKDLAGPIKVGNKWSIFKINDTQYIRIDLNDIEGENMHTTYIIKCGPHIDDGRYKHKLINVTENKINENEYTTIYFESEAGCPAFDFYFFWKFLNDYKWLFAILLILVGLFLCGFGIKLMAPTIFIITCVCFTVVIVVVFFQFIVPPGTADWLIFVILFIGLCLGSFAGFFISKYKDKVFPIIIGGLTGYFLGEFLYKVVGTKIHINQTVVRILFIVIFAIILIILSFFLNNFMIIFATSLIGSYIFLRGISLLAGGLPSEFEIAELIEKNEIEQLKQLIDWKVICYIVAFVLCVLISIITQYKIRKDDNKAERELKKERNFDENLIKREDYYRINNSISGN